MEASGERKSCRNARRNASIERLKQKYAALFLELSISSKDIVRRQNNLDEFGFRIAESLAHQD
jgi:hypothetical protein